MQMKWTVQTRISSERTNTRNAKEDERRERYQHERMPMMERVAEEVAEGGGR